MATLAGFGSTAESSAVSALVVGSAGTLRAHHTLAFKGTRLLTLNYVITFAEPPRRRFDAL